jgi:hypothetical protein
MSNIELIKGIWTAIAYESDGVRRSPAELEGHARLLILPDKLAPSSDGAWGAVAYRGALTPETVEQSIQALKQLIQGQDYVRKETFHIYTGGILHLGPEGCIDFEVYHGAELYMAYPKSVNLGIYQLDGTRLNLCLAETAITRRPTAFDSTQTPGQSLATYIREQDMNV